ncbi:hypothetical protein L0Z13_11555 [Burkholderia multivorans]|uniref:hypothetical protein n=1 Tax=Burkholderia multivorans TaxID=87883 RepID=UPI0020183F07|nr:hypothetical protein [Burkholderia multivorans]UQO07999.1 hypothetical protein L0Z13_11555 [Burkholderia multivorans]
MRLLRAGVFLDRAAQPLNLGLVIGQRRVDLLLRLRAAALYFMPWSCSWRVSSFTLAGESSGRAAMSWSSSARI